MGAYAEGAVARFDLMVVRLVYDYIDCKKGVA
jgi:hypothetical protein